MIFFRLRVCVGCYDSLQNHQHQQTNSIIFLIALLKKKGRI